MSTGIKRPYEQVFLLADGMRAKLAPFCKRVEIAGSVRRQQALCGDLEFVCIADGERLNEYLNGLLATGKINHVAVGPKKTRRWGEKMKSFTFEISDRPMQVDVFITTPDRWGYNFLIRTGSSGFSNRMVTPVGVRTHNGLPGLMPPDFFCLECLVYGPGGLCATPEEADIFALWGMAYVAPGERTDAYKPVTVAQAKPTYTTAAPAPVVSVHKVVTVAQPVMVADVPEETPREHARRAARIAAYGSADAHIPADYTPREAIDMMQREYVRTTKGKGGAVAEVDDGALGPIFETVEGEE